VRRDLLPALRRAQASFDAELLGLSRRAAAWRTELSGLVDRGIRHAILIDERGRPMLDVAAEDLTGYSRSMLGIVWPELAARVGVTLDARGTRRAAEFTISSRTGGRMQLAGGWELVRSRAWFEVRPAREARAVATEALPLDPPMRWDRWTFRFGERDGKRDAWSASFPADAVLDVRVWRPGDRLKIHYGGRLIARKVKYFLSDAGISGHIRPRWPVVVAGDEILWIPGVRRSDAATARSGRPVVTYVCDYLDRRS
jgi:tRNA(Ile)-lysidine synthase